MSEVSAVVLSVGEPYTRRAIESLGVQSTPLREIIVVDKVSPFFRAINEGARRVGTPFFVQVDADMILDSMCVEMLLAELRDDTGIVVAELRDALMGQTVGVKLFRTACFQRAGMPDSISPDTDFGATLQRRGWRTRYVEGTGGHRPALGEHRPDYSPSYTYRKFILEGSRLRHRGARDGLFWSMSRLEESAHPVAILAQVALAHGFFLPSERDELGPPTSNLRAEQLFAFLGMNDCADTVAAALPLLNPQARLRAVFHRFLAVGEALAQARAGATFREILAQVSGTRHDSRALVAKVALGHGALMQEGDRVRLPSDTRAFRKFMVYGLGRRASAWDHLRARWSHVAAMRRGSRSSVRW